MNGYYYIKGVCYFIKFVHLFCSYLICLLPSFDRGLRTEELQKKDLTAYTFFLIYFGYLNR
jgi:hypothetical protein